MTVELFGWNAPAFVVIWIIVGIFFVPAASWMFRRTDRGMTWLQAYGRAMLLPLLAVALPIAVYLLYLVTVAAVSFVLALVLTMIIIAVLGGGGGSILVIFIIFDR